MNHISLGNKNNKMLLLFAYFFAPNVSLKELRRQEQWSAMHIFSLAMASFLSGRSPPAVGVSVQEASPGSGAGRDRVPGRAGYNKKTFAE